MLISPSNCQFGSKFWIRPYKADTFLVNTHLKCSPGTRMEPWTRATLNPRRRFLVSSTISRNMRSGKRPTVNPTTWVVTIISNKIHREELKRGYEMPVTPWFYWRVRRGTNSRPSRIHMRDVLTSWSINALRFLPFISYSRLVAVVRSGYSSW